jgi:hypothetical protein
MMFECRDHGLTRFSWLDLVAASGQRAVSRQCVMEIAS